MYTERELRDLWKKHGFRPKRKFGQNFLTDRNVRDRIIRAVDPRPEDEILEIGPGFGELTFDLARMASRVHAVEKDRGAAVVLRHDSNSVPGGRLVIIEDDILDVPLDPSWNKIVGNLPYYITTPIIEKCINAASRPDMYFMMQKEYAARLAAGPGTKQYGSLSVFARFFSRVTVLFTVSRTCFYPEPGVDSVFVHMHAWKSPPVPVRDTSLMFRIIRTAFNQRRKMLKNTLASIVGGSARARVILDQCGVPAQARPEELSLEAFAGLANMVHGFVNVKEKQG